ncbi:D-2-hydroxyacid dehydrogenase [Alkaliphilus transvaalensis]|uniref:D-2-hydroxyacid dehydrogenase n=1 Tax=Alkaliphilus transvaalensis TaxID=114628 RepID=UPI00047A1B45|nr:D-2-hydroxyacid dehydrogenase [Alkaliphilus transvaalensis]
MKIVVLDGYTLNPGDLSWESLGKIGELTVYDRTAFDLSGKEEIIKRIGDAEIVFTNKTPLNREIIENLPKLKYIGVLATGYNVVDVEAAKERGITVTNIPTYGTAAVAQFTFALLLELCHHVGNHSEAVYKGKWTNSQDWCFWNHPLIELEGKTMGIIGYGRIGQRVARIAHGFGMKVIAFNHRPKALDGDVVTFVDLDELYKKSDVISLHCPLFEDTKGMINKETIEKMKDGVLIINTSRGPLIDEEDLAGALNRGKIGGAAVDVVTTEPIKESNPLLKSKNCIITPHIAWAPKEARSRLMEIAIDNLEKYLSGNPVNVVKPSSISPVNNIK